MSFRAYFVSDIHLKSGNEKNAQIFARFLNRVVSDESTTHLFLVGDIFDFWISDHAYFIEKFSDIVTLIDKAVQKRIEVHYFEGNHDLHLEKYWSRKVGVKVHSAPKYFEIDGVVIRVEHGDLIDPEDKGYLFLKSVLQTKAIKYIADHAHEKVVSFVGEKASQASRRYTSTTKTISDEESREKHRAYAGRSYRERPFDFMISGHIHVKDDYTFSTQDNQVAKAVNLGSWMEEPLMFCCSGRGSEFQRLV